MFESNFPVDKAMVSYRTLWNAFKRIASGAGELYLWVDNLQDKRYDQYVYYFTPNANVGMPTRGRTVGLGFTWQFF